MRPYAGRAIRAIQITEFGGPEVLVLRDVDDPDVPDGFVLADVSAAGVNLGSNRSCEIALQQGTGRAYASFVFALEAATSQLGSASAATSSSASS